MCVQVYAYIFKGFCVVGARLNDFPICSHHVHWTANPTTKCSIFKHARLGPVWRVLVLYSGPWFYCWCWNWALPLSFVTCLECLRMVWDAWQKWKARAKRAIKWEKGYQEVIVKLWCWESWAIGVSKFTATVANRNWICLYYNSMLWEFWLLQQMQQVRHWNNVTNATNETPTRHCLSATWAPAKTSDILEQLHQDIDTWYYHETLRNDRGDTKNDDFWYTCLPDFIANIKSSGTMRDTQKNDDHFSHVLSRM